MHSQAAFRATDAQALCLLAVAIDVATQEEQRALISALSESPELAARLRAFQELNADIK
jgi:hypothetical protein